MTNMCTMYEMYECTYNNHCRVQNICEKCYIDVMLETTLIKNYYIRA